MIKNIGIDIAKIKRFRNKSNTFINHVLTNNELQYFSNLANKNRRTEFLAGRWVIKEAVIKAWDKNISMIDIEVVFEQKHLGIKIKNQNINNAFISISHYKKYAIGMVVIEND